VADAVTPTKDAPTTAPASGENIGEILSQINQSVRDAVAEQVTKALEPVTQKQGEFETMLADLQKNPQSQSGHTGAALFGVRKGENSMGSRGFMFSKAFSALRSGNWENAKVERDIHDRLHQFYGGHLETEGILTPLGAEFMHGIDQSFAVECQQLVRQGVCGSDLDEFRMVARGMRQALGGFGRVSQDLDIYDDTAGGVLLGATQHGEMIDLLRAREFFTNAGAMEFAFPPNGRIQWPKQTGSSTGYWVGQAQSITESNITTGMLNMAAKKLAAISDFPNELLRFANMSVEAFVRMDIAKTLALKLDSTLLTATGSDVEPKGLINYSGINTVVASVTGTDGDTLQPEDITTAVATVEEQEIDTDRFTFGIRPLMWAKVKNRRADAITANDQKGPYLFQTDGPATLQRPGNLMGHDAVKTTQIPNNRTKGSASNLTMVLGGNFSEYLIGRVGVIEFTINPWTQTNFRQDLTSIRAIQHVDGQPRREAAFVMIDDLIT
jgi:HK97 family phage major capsid protein